MRGRTCCYFSFHGIKEWEKEEEKKEEKAKEGKKKEEEEKEEKVKVGKKEEEGNKEKEKQLLFSFPHTDSPPQLGEAAPSQLKAKVSAKLLGCLDFAPITHC